MTFKAGDYITTEKTTLLWKSVYLTRITEFGTSVFYGDTIQLLYEPGEEEPVRAIFERREVFSKGKENEQRRATDEEVADIKRIAAEIARKVAG